MVGRVSAAADQVGGIHTPVSVGPYRPSVFGGTVLKPEAQICPFHTDEFIVATYVGSETAEYEYTCPRQQHPSPGPFTWSFVSEPVGLAGDSLGLGLDIELPKAVEVATAAHGTVWVEYGLIEASYAQANPEDWATLLKKYSHTHYCKTHADRQALTYTASKYLARSLGSLGRRGTLVHHNGPGTGRWDYNQPISYYSLQPSGPWDSRTTWQASTGQMADYMPET
jgi:hypothetical protein